MTDFQSNIKKVYERLPVSLQNLVVTLKGLGIFRERYGKEFKTSLLFLRETQWFSYERLYELQCNFLQVLIPFAVENIPYYKRLFQEYNLSVKSIQTPDDLKKIPILTKSLIRKFFPDLIAQNSPVRKLKLGHTSGTTGSPLEFYWDKKVIYMTNAVLWRQREWGGVNVGDPFVLLTGNVVVPLLQKKPPFWRHNFVQNQLLVSSFHLNPENMKAIVQKLKNFKPAFLEAYPSTAYILGRYLVDIKDVVPLKAVFTSSEPLYPNYREIIEKAFGCRVYDYLGMAERVIFATQCEQHEGHHLNLEYGVTEIVDEDGNPVTPGSIGSIVSTGLHNFAMPLIRYRTGDRTAFMVKQCRCGRHLPLIEDVTTKEEDIVLTPDGRFISPSVLTHPFKPLHGILESQLIQEDLHHLRIKLVRADRSVEIDIGQLVQGIKDRVGAEMKIEVEFVESIPRTKSGKFRWIISKVPLKI
ncbi:MAG: phenylacetate--CoA ligase family protein [Nitrospiria bacterium]